MRTTLHLWKYSCSCAWHECLQLTLALTFTPWPLFSEGAKPLSLRTALYKPVGHDAWVSWSHWPQRYKSTGGRRHCWLQDSAPYLQPRPNRPTSASSLVARPILHGTKPGEVFLTATPTVMMTPAGVLGPDLDQEGQRFGGSSVDGPICYRRRAHAIWPSSQALSTSQPWKPAYINYHTQTRFFWRQKQRVLPKRCYSLTKPRGLKHRKLKSELTLTF